MKDVKV